MNLFTHYLPGVRTVTTCGIDTTKINVTVSLFSQDVDCIACKRVFAEMLQRGFIPKR